MFCRTRFEHFYLVTLYTMIWSSVWPSESWEITRIAVGNSMNASSCTLDWSQQDISAGEWVQNQTKRPDELLWNYQYSFTLETETQSISFTLELCEHIGHKDSSPKNYNSFIYSPLRFSKPIRFQIIFGTQMKVAYI